ncbi:MAG: hypothetical protein IT294_11060 [Deltaproteobacteria bacterium]|nr:hypothetical protein [Deltaproteobacteria bacterium]
MRARLTPRRSGSRRTPPLAALPLVVAAIAAVLPGRVAADVAIDGVVVPKAKVTMEITQDVIEFRTGTDPNPQVLPGAKRYGVCVLAAAPVAALDAELPRGDTATRLTVQAGDGRTFVRCLVTGLETEGAGAKHQLKYCLRCEDVTIP